MNAGEIWTAVDLLKWTTDWFEKKGVASPRRQAEELLCTVMDVDRLQLYLHYDYRPTPSERKWFKELIQRRADGEPLQHLRGRQDFCGLKLKTDRRALIPRVETEALAENLVARMSGKSGWTAFDIGTGGGCLALALAKAGGKVKATDLSPQALELARENARATGLDQSIEFFEGDLFAFGESDTADLIVSNPPYIGEDEKPSLDREVRDFEPAMALFSGDDGSHTLRRLLNEAPKWLKPGGFLAIEMAPRHAAWMLETASKGPWSQARVEKDDQGKERYFFAELNAANQVEGWA